MLLRNKKVVPTTAVSHSDTVDMTNKLPPEILANIFSFVDSETILNCRLVSKRWKTIVEKEVFRFLLDKNDYKEIMIQGGKDCTWQTFFLLWKKNPLDKNLLLSNNEEEITGSFSNWDIMVGHINQYIQGPSHPITNFPILDIYERSNTYYVAGCYGFWEKTHVISLEEKGFTTDMLTKLQPAIEISEWFVLRKNTSCAYNFSAELLTKQMTNTETFRFTADVADGKWKKISYPFEKYGNGVAIVRIRHQVKTQFYRDSLPECIITGEVLRVHFTKPK